MLFLFSFLLLYASYPTLPCRHNHHIFFATPSVPQTAYRGFSVAQIRKVFLMKIHHLNCGTLCPICAQLLNGTGGFFARGELVCHCLLVESEDGLVLIDTGIGQHDIDHPRRLGAFFDLLSGPVYKPQETAIAQVKALGFQPSDVRHIIPTHLDLDHAGGLADFPHAKACWPAR